MPLLISGAAAVVSAMNRAFSDTSPSNAVYANQIAEAGTTAASQAAWAVSFGSKFTGTSAQLADLLLTNTGIKAAGGTALATAVAAIIDIVGVKNVGQVAMLLSNALSTLEADATYGTAAKAWNAEVTAAYEYSASTANTTASSSSATTGNEAASSYVLTTAQDIRNGTSGNDFFRGVAGQPIGAQEQTTFNSSDILDGLAGADTLIINLVGNYNGGARVKNIETLQLGVNVAGAAAFDYNVNAGANEITEVTTIVADQINGGETLTVNNIVRTVAGDARVMPTLSWVNDSNTATAGTVNYAYRAAELTGTTDTQIVSLDSVNNGVLNLAAGIETVTLRSVAGERVTLLNSGNGDTGTNAVAADIVSSGSLARVNIEAAAEVGKVGGRAGNGLIDNAAQIGLANTGTGENLLSVGARVTTVDANTSTANVNVQFLAKTDGAATNVTFTGGAGNDYAEFEIGNINATGGVGNDTFAFVTQRNGVTNSTFGAGDSIVGGAGTDVIQIGVNGNTVGAKNAAGASTYTISDSEWANKSGVEIVDLRGATNTITLSSGFVAAPDAGVKLTVTTDNMVVGGASNNEYNSVNTVDLRMLSGGQGINFVGGQGSDRLILSDTTYTSAMTLNGGSNVDALGNAVANDYDTLTVSNSAVLDRTDLSATSGFEGLVLTKTVTGAVTTVIELTEAFLLANTAAVNSTTTTINDSVFQIGTAAGANGTALRAGDIVRIDVTDLFTVGGGNPVKGSVSARQIDTTTLTAAGVTLQYVFNGTSYASLAALNAVVGANTVLAGADVAGQTGVVGGAVALPNPVTGANVVFTATDGNSTTGWNTQGNLVATAQGDTINVGNFVLTAAAIANGGAGVNTLVARDGANLAAATVANVTQLTFDATGVAGTNDLTMTQTQHAGFTGTVTAAGTGANGESITVTTGGAVAALAGVENYTVSAGGANNVTVNAATTGVNITGNAANATTVTIGGQAVNGTYALGNAADVIVATTGANITGVNAGALTTAETLNLTGTITMTAAQYGNGTTTGLTTNAIINGGVADRINISDAFNAAIGAQANVVETVALQAAGNDTVNVTTGAAADFIGTLDISAGGNDTITLTNAAQNAGTANSMTIAGFTATAGANMDVIRVVDTGVATISGPLTAVNAGANTNYGGAVNSVIEIENGGVVTLADVGAGNTVETLIGNAVGNLVNGTYTVVVYGGTANANAGIYSLVSTAAGGDATAANITVELLGVVTGVGVNGLAGGNFAI